MDQRWGQGQAANYCGNDWAGHLLVQSIPNLASVTWADRVVIPVYEFLGDWNHGVAPWTPATMAPTNGPLGPEMPRSYYTCPSDPVNGPTCSDGNHTVGG